MFDHESPAKAPGDVAAQAVNRPAADDGVSRASGGAGTAAPSPERREGSPSPEATPTPTASPGGRETAAPDPYRDVPEIPEFARRT
jgi:hypothetical protein